MKKYTVRKAIELHGEFAYTNFHREDYIKKEQQDGQTEQETT